MSGAKQAPSERNWKIVDTEKTCGRCNWQGREGVTTKSPFTAKLYLQCPRCHGIWWCATDGGQYDATTGGSRELFAPCGFRKVWALFSRDSGDPRREIIAEITSGLSLDDFEASPEAQEALAQSPTTALEKEALQADRRRPEYNPAYIHFASNGYILAVSAGVEEMEKLENQRFVLEVLKGGRNASMQVRPCDLPGVAVGDYCYSHSNGDIIYRRGEFLGYRWNAESYRLGDCTLAGSNLPGLDASQRPSEIIADGEREIARKGFHNLFPDSFLKTWREIVKKSKGEKR